VHEDDVNAVCFGNDGSNILLSGADDGLVKVWDRRTMNGFGRAQPVGVFAGHRDGITFIDSRGDDKYFLSNSKDQTIKVWDIRHFASQKAIVRLSNLICNDIILFRIPLVNRFACNNGTIDGNVLLRII
jgi:WD40 repeat protein